MTSCFLAFFRWFCLKLLYSCILLPSFSLLFRGGGLTVDSNTFTLLLMRLIWANCILKVIPSIVKSVLRLQESFFDPSLHKENSLQIFMLLVRVHCSFWWHLHILNTFLFCYFLLQIRYIGQLKIKLTGETSISFDLTIRTKKSKFFTI